MRNSRSLRYQPQSGWAAGLRARALSELDAPDRAAVLAAFRRHNAYYANRLADAANWHDVPPLNKAELADVPVNTTEPVFTTRSSGTSGMQVEIINSVAERRFRQALAYRPFLFYPLEATVRQVIFIDGTDVDAPDKQQWPFEFGGRMYFTWRVGIAAEPERIHALLQAVRPAIVRGLTSGIVRFVELAGTPLDDLGARVVSPSGEHLSDAWRASLNAAFAAPVLDRYGSTETGALAWQCPYCNAYHANADEVILEDSAAGLLATPMYIETQPLLRYSLGDRVELREPAQDCRVRLPALRILEARRDDWLIDGAGRKVSPLSFQFERVSGLTAWRIHQLPSGRLRLYYDSRAEGAGLRMQLQGELARIVPGREIELVSGAWNLVRDGKFKRVVSDAAPGSEPLAG